MVKYEKSVYLSNNESIEKPIRPLVYLQENIKYIEGNGTESNPYQIYIAE